MGCGGTGIEILKLIVKYHHVTVIDKDRIEMVNLNRLFPFTPKDIGRYKSQAAALHFGCEYEVGDLLELDCISKYDCVILAVDNIETRMHLNFLYKKSTCGILVDCGVLNDSCHALITNRDGFCLYCIKEMYDESINLNLCSLKYLQEKIDKDNRLEILKSFVLYYKNEGNTPEEIVDKFNLQSRTTLEEVFDIYENVIPSICYINSICASLVMSLLLRSANGNKFVYYNGSKGIFTKCIDLKRDEKCLLCNKYKE